MAKTPLSGLNALKGGESQQVPTEHGLSWSEK